MEEITNNSDRIYNFLYFGKNIDTLIIGNNVKHIDNLAFYGANINNLLLYSDIKLNEVVQTVLENTNVTKETDDSNIKFPETNAINVDFHEMTLNPEEIVNLYSNKLDTNVNFVIDNTDVAELDESGNLLAKNPGTTTVSVKDSSGNINLIIVKVPAPKQEIQLEDFDNTTETPLEFFTYYVYDDYFIITGVAKEHQNENVPNLIFPSLYNGTPLTQIRIGYEFDGIMVNNSGAFNNWGVKYIKIPDTVELITNGAFYNITTLERVDLPATSPKYYDECYNTLFLPELGRDYATSSTFSFCDGLKKVVIPNGWKRIPAHYFNLCHNLEEVIIPDSIEEIGVGAFGGCEKLSKFNIPENLKSYEWFLSQGNLEKQFTELTLPESCISISNNAFAYIYLNKLTIKGRVEIGSSAFRDGQFIELILEKGASNANELSNSDFRYSKCGTLRVPKEEINNYKHLTCFNRILPLEDEVEEIVLIPCKSLNIYPSKPETSKIAGSSSSYPRYILAKEESMNITYTKFPFDTTDVVTFESNKPDFVKVSSDGKVTGLEYLYFDRFNKENSCATISIKCGNITRTIKVCVEL